MTGPELRACVDVDDLEKGIAFYTGALGLRLGRRSGSAWAEILGASSPIDLLASPAGSPAHVGSVSTRNYRRHWTPVHLDFAVADIELAVRRAQDAGATLERDVQVQAWGKLANMADPFGHGFCLLEMNDRGYDAIADRGA